MIRVVSSQQRPAIANLAPDDGSGDVKRSLEVRARGELMDAKVAVAVAGSGGVRDEPTSVCVVGDHHGVLNELTQCDCRYRHIAVDRDVGDIERTDAGKRLVLLDDLHAVAAPRDPCTLLLHIQRGGIVSGRQQPSRRRSALSVG